MPPAASRICGHVGLPQPHPLGDVQAADRHRDAGAKHDVGGFRIALDIVLGLLHPECPAHDVEVTQGRREGIVCRDRFGHVRQRSNGEQLEASPVLRRGLLEQVRRGDAFIDLHPIEPGNALPSWPCPPDRPPVSVSRAPIPIGT